MSLCFLINVIFIFNSAKYQLSPYTVKYEIINYRIKIFIFIFIFLYRSYGPIVLVVIAAECAGVSRRKGYARNTPAKNSTPIQDHNSTIWQYNKVKVGSRSLFHDNLAVGSLTTPPPKKIIKGRWPMRANLS